MHHVLQYSSTFPYPTCPIPFLAEATCSSAIRTANNIVKDIGEQAARASGGLLELAKCNERNAEETTHRLLVGKLGLSLPIPLKPMTPEDHPITEDDPVYSCLLLSDWARFILQHRCWHVLAGLRHPDEQREMSIWLEFWKRYEAIEPGHPIFQANVDLSRCAAIVAHGVEGRGRRRSAFMVCSFHSCLGFGTNAATTVASNAGKRQKVLKEYLKMTTNYKDHTYCTRFLCGVLPKKAYGPGDENLRNLLRVMASEAAFMATTGIQDARGHTYRMVMVKNVGDWPWLHKSGCFSRSFNNIQKHLSVKTNPAGICHLCRAGQADCPAEDYMTRMPKWKATMFQQSPFAKVPEFAVVPHPPNRLESLFPYDLFHTWSLGVGKNYLGSILAILVQREEASNIEERFEILTSRYLMFCKETQRSPIIQTISKDTIQWSSMSTYPSGGWFKGSLTTNLFAWVQHRGRTEDFSDDPLLVRALEGGDAMEEALRRLYEADAWIPSSQAQHIAELGLRFLRRYSEAAKIAHDSNAALFVLMPKLHALQHIMLGLLDQSSSVRYAPNPLIWSVQADEDFIGRPSRLARRVSAPTVVKRVLQRYLQAAYKQWVRAGFIVQVK